MAIRWWGWYKTVNYRANGAIACCCCKSSCMSSLKMGKNGQRWHDELNECKKITRIVDVRWDGEDGTMKLMRMEFWWVSTGLTWCFSLVLFDEVVGMVDGVENLWKVADVIADHGRRFGHISTIESRQRRFKFEIILCVLRLTPSMPNWKQ